MNAIPDSLLQNPLIWRGDALARSHAVVSSGFPTLDAELPGGGWPKGALTEILLARPGIGEMRLLLPALRQLTRDGAWVVLVSPPYLPYAPALAGLGMNLGRVMRVQASSLKEQLWACEQALKSPSCGAVLIWLPAIDDRHIRRLQLAAAEGHGWGILIRPASLATGTTWAALRLQLTPEAGRLGVRILKRRGGGTPSPLQLDLPHAVDLSPVSSAAA